ncbi:bridge-like lipid transfer protein family member 3B isoform X2 [Saccostrea echinata]|uniref:bridge-like lipid transfer protein family member 3B isoform X2 n=1 Tax=Saccostrea echinata TaxID=191078 RepID=UPI002A80BFF8|nr:bridge-like lipid transfer protein family member 3B isoform X2 [Saccostrea echinata]
MASIIKNQILKHLSKFTKNMSPDKINLSTLKGEGELSNLELDEVVLMELLDMPTWMKLSKAVCNRLSIKVQWTKLKSQPLCLYLDEVELEIETCNTPRPPNSPAHVASYRSGGKYGFVDRVIDGMYVHINSVLVKFISRKFHASLQLSRVKVQSVTPNWKPSDDLGPTKIRDTVRGQILLFKEFDWQTTRIEATAVEGETSETFLTTPLRFIANQSKIRITIKKRLSDCGVISTRVMLLLDDLLWVLTDTQLKAAILYINSLKDMIEKSREQSKNNAAEALDIQGLTSLYNDNSQSQRPRSQSNPSHVSQLFERFDVQTTSYHVISSRIDLHLCDDNTTDTKNIPGHNSQIEGGAMQVIIHKLSVDIYPFFPAGGERKNWYRYTDNQGSRNPWVQQLFSAFKKQASKARETVNIASPSQSPAHKLTNKNTENTAASQSKTSPSRPPPPNTGQGHGSPNQRRHRSTKLLESCYVIKIEEFTIYQVSTADNKRNNPQKFLSSDKKQLHLPPDMSVLHAEYTDYFFPEDIGFPVPHANLYVLLNPIRLNVDWLTLLWANFFMLNLSKSIERIELEDVPLEHVDTKVEAIMPRIVVPFDEKCELPDFPSSVQLQISRMCATNTRVSGPFSRDSLSDIISNYAASPLFCTQKFPNDNNSLRAIPETFNTHAKNLENHFIEKRALDLLNGCAQKFSQEEVNKIWKSNTLKHDASFDMWCCHAEQVWLEFLGPSNVKSRPLPFVESIPLTLWISKSPPKAGKEGDKSDKVMEGSESRLPNGDSISVGEKSSKEEYSDSDREKRQTRRLLKDYYSDESVTTSEESETSQFQGSPSTCDTENGAKDDNVQYSALRVADFNVVAKIGPGPLKAQMTHSQYIFIMRLQESFTIFQTQMNADVSYFITTVSPTVTFSVPLMLSELEFAMLCPVVLENPGIPVTFISPPTSTSGQDDLMDEVIEKDESTVSDSLAVNESQDDSSNRSFPIVDIMDLSHHTLGKSYSESNVQNFAPDSSQPPLTHAILENNLQSRISQSTQALGSVGRESGYGSLSEAPVPQSKKILPKTTDSMKKFTSKMSGLADKIKAKMENLGDDSSSISDSLDSMSIRTDSSEDDFEELSLDDVEVPAFQKARPISESLSTDTDAADDLSSFCAEQNAAEARGKETISVVLFKLTSLELLLQGDGEDMAARIQAQQLLTIQPGNMIYDTFHQKFLSPTGFFGQEKLFTPISEPAVKLKFTSGPGSKQESCLGSEEGFLAVKAHDFGLHFKTSSLTTLTNFVEDDKPSESIPMHVDVSNFMLILQDDVVPPGFPNPPEPTHIQIHSLTIMRGRDGVMHLNQNMISDRNQDTKDLNGEVDELKGEVQVLKQSNYEECLSIRSVKLQLQELEVENRLLREENRKSKCSPESETAKEVKQLLETYTTENARLIERIAHLEDELLSVTQEKNSFIETLSLLQDELNLSERRRHDSDK